MGREGQFCRDGPEIPQFPADFGAFSPDMRPLGGQRAHLPRLRQHRSPRQIEIGQPDQSEYLGRVLRQSFVAYLGKCSGEIDLKSGAVAGEQVTDFIVDGFLRPGGEVAPMVFGLHPEDLDHVQFGTVRRQVEQLHAMFA